MLLKVFGKTSKALFKAADASLATSPQISLVFLCNNE
jgi:hypothetical protein